MRIRMRCSVVTLFSSVCLMLLVQFAPKAYAIQPTLSDTVYIYETVVVYDTVKIAKSKRGNIDIPQVLIPIPPSVLVEFNPSVNNSSVSAATLPIKRIIASDEYYNNKTNNEAMKRELLLGIAILSLQAVAYPQQYFGVKVGTNHPLKTQFTARRFGTELGFMYGRQIKENLFFETGLVVEAYGRRKTNAYMINPMKSWEMLPYTEEASFLRLGGYLPFYLNFRLSRFEFKGGLILYFRNALTLTKFPGFDPEKTYLDPQKFLYPSARTLSFEPNIEVGYRIVDWFNIYANFRYGVLSGGAVFRF